MNYPNLDLIIKNSLIIDGTGQQGYSADLGITGDKIVLIKKDINCPARTVLDASGLVAAPGFIDIHSHSDCCSFLPSQKMTSKLYQGVTLEVIGNCGISCFPINEQCRQIVTKFFTANLELPLNGMFLEDNTVLDYANHVKRCPAATNIGVLLPAGNCRPWPIY
jgi:N-acyl-D-amino-acid deacylase